MNKFKSVEDNQKNDFKKENVLLTLEKYLKQLLNKMVVFIIHTPLDINRISYK